MNNSLFYFLCMLICIWIVIDQFVGKKIISNLVNSILEG